VGINVKGGNTQCGVLGDDAKKHVREENVVMREIKCIVL